MAQEPETRRDEGTPAVATWTVFARQLRRARELYPMSARELADRVRDLGFDGPNHDRIRKIEAGGLPGAKPDADSRARSVRLEEVVACAAALSVAPVWLIVPFTEEDSEPVRLGHGSRYTLLTPETYQSWVRGTRFHAWHPRPSKRPEGGVPKWFYYLGFVPRWQRQALAREAEDTPMYDDEGKPVPADEALWLVGKRPRFLLELIQKGERDRIEES